MAKWIDVDDVSQPVAEVATRILQLRLAFVHKFLPLAANNSHEDAEHVHQLRVACRRAAAAVQAFRPLLKKNARGLKSLLRHIRRAAGPARDADVLIQRLAAEANSLPDCDDVISRLQGQRAKAQPALISVANDSNLVDLDNELARCKKVLRKQARSKRAESFAEFGRQALRVATEPILAASQVEHASIAELHQFRIAGKRLRYSIEIFHDVFPNGLRTDIYPRIEEIQTRLGQLNDHATAQLVYQKWLAKMPADERAAQLAQRIVHEHQAARAVHASFLDWWSTSLSTAFRTQISSLLNR